VRRLARVIAAALNACAAGVVLVGGASPSLAADEVFPVVDLHVDLPWQLHFRKKSLDLSRGQMSRTAIERGHVEGLVLPLYVPDEVRAEGPRIDDHLAMLSTLDRVTELSGSPLTPLGRMGAADDAGDAFLGLEPPPKRPVRSFLSFEGAGAFADDPARIDAFLALGVRLVGLVHMHDNALGTSSTGAAKGRSGLTEKGKALAARVYERGALIDVSHLSDRGFDDLVPIAKAHGAPIVATHSDARAVYDVPRNLTDTQLRIIGATGGVVGLNLHSPYLMKGTDAGWDEIVAHVLHLQRVAGEDAVAIGSDFEGGILAPGVMKDASAFPELARRLKAAGLSSSAIRKMFATNALRILAPRVAPKPTTLLASRAMSGDLSRYLDVFPTWLKTLGGDANDLAKVVSVTAANVTARTYAASGLNYLFKSLDLIPDGIEDLGYIDDAFVLRVACAVALRQDAAAGEGTEGILIRRLARDAEIIAEFLGDDYARLETYVKGLTKGAARGRTVAEITGDEATATAFVGEVASWTSSYEAPSFTRDEKTLVRLRSFFETKLPKAPLAITIASVQPRARTATTRRTSPRSTFIRGTLETPMAEPSVVVACTKCRQPNRLPVRRIGGDGKCGACKTPLPAPTDPVDATDADFLEIVGASPVPVVVDFWAPWCGPCRMVSPILEDLAAEHSGQLLFVKVNTDDNQGVAQQFGIRSIPHLMVFEAGKKVADQVGAPPRAALEKWIASFAKE
jgi:membrane dipeptidase